MRFCSSAFKTLISRGPFSVDIFSVGFVVTGCGLGMDVRSRGAVQQSWAAVSVFLSQRERQAQREGTLELTEKLDQDWKEVRSLLARKAPRSENRDTKEKPQVGGKR